MEPCIYLGHDAMQNCAVVWVLATEKLQLSRDIKFRENSFTHSAALIAGEDRVQEIVEEHQPEDTQEPQDEQKDEPAQGEEEPEWAVEKILQKRGQGRKLEYLVQWEGLPASKASWEPAENCEGAPEAVAEFEAAEERSENEEEKKENHQEA